jgi:glycosyltransferase involved in cell wall biosynthesis
VGLDLNIKRIIIYDPYLQDEVGHYATYDKAVYDELWRQDRPCHSMGRKKTILPWVNTLFNDSLQVPFFTVKNLRQLLGRRPKNSTSGKVEMPNKRTMQKFIKAIIACFDILNILYINVQHFFIAKRFIYCTIFVPMPTQYYAFGVCLSSLFSHSDIILMYRFAAEIPTLVARIFKKVRFVTDTSGLAIMFKKATKTKFEVWSIPYVQIDVEIENKNKILTVGYIGTLRIEKGIETILKVIKKLQSQDIQFIIQANVSHASKRELAIVEELRKFANVQLLEKDQTNEEYQETLASMDVVLLPYSLKTYRLATSQTLMDTIAFEKVPIVTKGTWMSRIVAHPWLEVKEDDVQGICDRIMGMQAYNVYKDYIYHIKRLKTIVFAEHNPKNFVKKLLA